MKKTSTALFTLLFILSIIIPVQAFGARNSEPLTTGRQLEDEFPPEPKWSAHCGDDIEGATVTDKPDDAALRSGLGSIVYNSGLSRNYLFDFEPFVPGDVSTAWRLRVENPDLDAKAVITFSDLKGNDTTIIIEYISTKLTIRPGRVDLGTLKAGQVRKIDFQAINYSVQSDILLDRLELWKKDQGFVISQSIPRGTIIPKNDSIKFQVTFIALNPGKFKDSVGLGDSCYFANRTELSAIVEEAVIEVSDYDYGKVGLGIKAGHTFQLKNKSGVDLVITDSKGPFTPGNIYTATGIPAMSPGNPWVIPPGQARTFDVEFAPGAETLYPDSIVFYSDASKIDNLALLNGEGIEPKLVTTGFSWGRKRINRPGFTNDGPYPVVDQHNAIYLFNDTPQAIHISGITEMVKVNSSAFEFSAADKAEMVAGFTLGPKQEKLIPVSFNPQSAGEYRLQFKWLNDANIDALTDLKGTGTVPLIEITPMLDFGPTVVNDFANAQKKTFVIKNIDYEFADSVTITDIGILAPGAVAADLTSWGSEGFRFDKAALKLPLVLQPGLTSPPVQAEFVAPKIGGLSSSITTVSDAAGEVKSDWKGKGFSQSLNSDGGSAKICAGSTAEIPIRIINGGSGKVSVTSIKISPKPASLDFKNPSDAIGFDLDGKTDTVVTLVYHPAQAEKLSTNVIVANTTMDNAESVSTVDLEAVRFSVQTSVQINNDKPRIQDRPVVTVIAGIQGQDISMAGVDRLDVKINYNGDFLRIIDPDSDISLGSALAGKFTIVPGSVNITPEGLVTLELAGIGNAVFNTSGEILKFTLSTFLPKLDSNASDINVEVQPRSNDCISILNTHSRLALQPVCKTDLRKIVAYGNNYSLQQAAPNPAGANGTEINFSVGLETMTEIGIYNTNGQLVALPVSDVLKPGLYSVRLEVDGLAPGLYICRMASGPFHKAVQLIIAK